jgi:hypothetical protein
MTARYTEELQPYVQNYIKERTFFQCHCNLQETQNLKLRKNLFSEADESVGECIWGSNTWLGASVGTLQTLLETWDLFLYEVWIHSGSSVKL